MDGQRSRDQLRVRRPKMEWISVIRVERPWGPAAHVNLEDVVCRIW